MWNCSKFLFYQVCIPEIWKIFSYEHLCSWQHFTLLVLSIKNKAGNSNYSARMVEKGILSCSWWHFEQHCLQLGWPKSPLSKASRNILYSLVMIVQECHRTICNNSHSQIVKLNMHLIAFNLLCRKKLGSTHYICALFKMHCKIVFI